MRHYRAAEKLVEPYRGLLDVWVGHWFGNEDAQEAFRLYGLTEEEVHALEEDKQLLGERS